MLFKAGVSLTGLVPQMVLALQQMEWLYDKIAGAELVVTSVNDGKHMDGSLHYQGRAADLRVHDIEVLAMMKIVSMAKERLDAHFDVVYEFPGTSNAHLHVEYDPE